MSTPRFGFENKKDCSNCGQITCRAIVSSKLSNKEQSEAIMECQNKNFKPVKR